MHAFAYDEWAVRILYLAESFPSWLNFVQFVRLTPLQESLYTHLLNSKEIRHAREGKQLDTLGAIRQLINICSHPKLLLDTFHAKQQCNEPVSEELVALVDIIRQYNSNNNNSASGGGSSGSGGPGTGSGKLICSISAKKIVLLS